MLATTTFRPWLRYSPKLQPLWDHPHFPSELEPTKPPHLHLLPRGSGVFTGVLSSKNHYPVELGQVPTTPHVRKREQ
ncbi:hypothetical protein PspLS_03702 [Pyricularia sp. CBS 133598]|nr:hypothetical protein PspLS_03702 [Pyricularia sp. CBS 133598]